MLLACISQGGIAHPLAVFVRFDTGGQALFVARPVAVDRGPEFIPVNLAVVVVTARFVPFQIRVRQSDT